MYQTFFPNPKKEKITSSLVKPKMRLYLNFSISHKFFQHASERDYIHLLISKKSFYKSKSTCIMQFLMEFTVRLSSSMQKKTLRRLVVEYFTVFTLYQGEQVNHSLLWVISSILRLSFHGENFYTSDKLDSFLYSGKLLSNILPTAQVSDLHMAEDTSEHNVGRFQRKILRPRQASSEDSL